MKKASVFNYYFRVRKGWGDILEKPEYIFAVLASIFGLIAVFIIPPGWNSDEYQHFFRVEQLAEGQLFATDELGNKASRAGGYINSGAVGHISSVGRFADNSETRYRLRLPSLLKDSPRYGDTGEKTYVQFNGAALYSPVAYIPQIIGVGAVKLVNGPIYLSIIFARILGLALYIVAMFWVIRRMPRGKWIVFTITLLATSVVQAAAFGADAMTFSSIAVFIAYVFHLAFDRKDLTRRRIAILAAMMIVVGLVKPTYFVLLPLVLIIPLVNDKYFNKRSFLLLFAVMVAAAIPALIWLALIGYVGHNGGENTNTGLQIRHVISNPFEFVATVVRTFFGVTAKGTWNHFYDVAFRNFVWDIVQFSKVYSYLAVVAIVLSLGVKDPVALKLKKARELLTNGVMVGVFFVAFMVIVAALYAHFTPLGSRVVYGVQARYIFPFLVLLLLPFQRVSKDQFAAKTWIVAILLVCLSASVIAIDKNIQNFVW